MNQRSLKEYIEDFKISSLIHEAASIACSQEAKPFHNRLKYGHYILAKLNNIDSTNYRLGKLVVMWEVLKLWLGYSNFYDLSKLYVEQLKDFCILLNLDSPSEDEIKILVNLEKNYFFEDDQAIKLYNTLGSELNFNNLKTSLMEYING